MTPVTDFLARRAELSPDTTAIIDAASGVDTSYAEWNMAANQTAGLLASLGVGVGDRVAVLSGNRREYLDLIFAAPKIGAVLLNLNWRLSAAELTGIVTEGEPSILVYSAELTALVDGLRRRPRRRHRPRPRRTSHGRAIVQRAFGIR